MLDGGELELLLGAEVREEPLLLIPVASASRPIDRGSRPSSVASRAAVSRIAFRVRSPLVSSTSVLLYPLFQALSMTCLTGIARSFYSGLMAIDHLTVPVRSYDTSKAFYEPVLHALGLVLLLDWPDNRRAYFGVPSEPSSLWLVETWVGCSRLGNTTHISVLDAEGGCASVTCSNGSCSGVVVPGTGMHLNNMLGEQDLNPLGYHRHEPGARVPSMMAPTVALRDGRPEVALGSAGSNRIRSAILQTLLAVVDHGLPAEAAVARSRIHVEGPEVEAEPGVDEAALAQLEQGGWTVRRWAEQNLFFGGVQAVARNPDTGELSGGGDPAAWRVRRGCQLALEAAVALRALGGALGVADAAERLGEEGLELFEAARARSAARAASAWPRGRRRGWRPCRRRRAGRGRRARDARR